MDHTVMDCKGIVQQRQGLLYDSQTQQELVDNAVVAKDYLPCKGSDRILTQKGITESGL